MVFPVNQLSRASFLCTLTMVGPVWSSYTYLQEHKELEGPGKEIKDTGSVATHVAKVCNALCIPRFKKKKRETFNTQKPNSMLLNVWVKKRHKENMNHTIHEQRREVRGWEERKMRG